MEATRRFTTVTVMAFVAGATLWPAPHIEAQTLVASIPVPPRPSSIAITSDGSTAFVSDINGMESVVRVIDTSTNTVVAAIDDPRFFNLSTLALTPDDAHLYVLGTGRDFVIDTGTFAVDALPTSGHFGAVAVTPDGTRVYIGKDPIIGNDATVFVLDAATNTVLDTITLPGTPLSTAQPSSIAILPDASRVFVTERNRDLVYVLDTSDNTTLTTIAVGDRPEGIDLTSNGDRAFVANVFSDDVSVIDTTSNTVANTIPVGDGPSEVHVTPNGCLAFVPNLLGSESGATDTISVFDTATESVITTFPTFSGLQLPGTFEKGIVGFTPDSGRAFVIQGSAVFVIDIAGLCPADLRSIDIDIKPGSFRNSINPLSEGVIAVAVLTTRTFDATTVDASSVEFGPNGATEAHGRGHVEDVDADGDLDLVVHFRTEDTGIACGQTTATLVGNALGRSVSGSDSISTVGCQ